MNMNNMICDLETGVCGVAGGDEMELIDLNPKKEITLYYITDPSALTAGHSNPSFAGLKSSTAIIFKLQTVMGGLLESWNGFADVKNGIAQPADVASLEEVGEHSRMPIDGSIWNDNPIKSSYIPSRVFKIVQKQDEKLATVFLRRAREAVFAFNQNIGEEQVLIEIVNQLGLDGKEIVMEANLPEGQQLLNEDFALARKLGARAFPTIIIVNEENKGVRIVGARPLESYVNGLREVLSATEELHPKPQPALSELLEKEVRLFSKEIEIMYDLEQNRFDSFIEERLSSDNYELKEILGEKYIEKK